MWGSTAAARIAPELKNTADVNKGASLLGQVLQIVSTAAVLRTIPVSLTRNIRTANALVAADGGGGDWYGVTGAAPGAYVDNVGTVIVPGDGSAAWMRHVQGRASINWFGAVADGDLAGSGTDNYAAVQAAFDAGLYDYGAEQGIYVLSAKPVLPVGASLTGAGMGRTIFDCNIGVTGSFGLSSLCKIEGFTVDSSFYPSSAIADTVNYGLSSRRIDLLTECTVRDIEIKNAGGGLTFGSSANNCRVYNYKFSDIRERNGQGAGYHISGAGDVRLFGIFGKNSDRGCEIEDGATDCLVQGGKLKSIYPVGYAGQPGGYSTTSFTLNAHSHDGLGGCKNIAYKDLVVDDCLLSIDSQRSSGVNINDMPQSCSWEDIRIVSPRTTAQAPNPIYIEGINCRLKNIILEGVALTSGDAVARFFGSDSRGCGVDGLEVGQKYNGTAVKVDAPRTTIKGLMIEDQTGVATVAGLVVVSAKHCRIMENDFITPESADSYIHVLNGADHCQVTKNKVTNPTLNDVATAAVFVEASYCRVSENEFDSTLNSPAVVVDAAAAFNGGLLNDITGNNIKNGVAGNVIEFRANTNRNLCTGNVTASNSQVILNSGTDNSVVNNKRGNVFS